MRAQRLIVFIVALPVSLSLLGIAFAGPTQSSDVSAKVQTDVIQARTNQTMARDYKLGPDDKIRLTVYNEEDLSGDFQIDGLGLVRLPLIGEINAAGSSVSDLEKSVEAALDDGYLEGARVNIQVTTYRPFYIIGQVNKPGEYPYVNNMTAVNAIALAGGFTGKAVESTIYIRHEGEVEEHALAVSQVFRVYPGDVLRVPETAFWSAADVVTPLSPFAYALTP